jgi:hypothetical protein
MCDDHLQGFVDGWMGGWLDGGKGDGVGAQLTGRHFSLMLFLFAKQFSKTIITLSLAIPTHHHVNLKHHADINEFWQPGVRPHQHEV